MKKVLVTGATGFLGRHIVRRLCNLEFEVVATGRNQNLGNKLFEKSCSFLKSNLEDLNPEDLGKGFHAIIHCAGLSSPFGSYKNFFLSNVKSSQNLLHFAKQSNVKRFVYISTPSIYFNFKDHFDIREGEPLPDPLVNHYATTKLEAEKEILQANSEKLATIALRPRAIFGPEDNTILPRLFRAAKSGVLPLFRKDPVWLDLSFIDNVVDAVEASLEVDFEHCGQAYNITNGESVIFQDFVEELFSRVNKKIRFRQIPYPLVYGLAGSMEFFATLFGSRFEPPLTRYTVGIFSHSMTLDITKAKNNLGYCPKVSMNEGLDRYAKWYLIQKDST